MLSIKNFKDFVKVVIVSEYRRKNKTKNENELAGRTDKATIVSFDVSQEMRMDVAVLVGVS